MEVPVIAANDRTLFIKLTRNFGNDMKIFVTLYSSKQILLFVDIFAVFGVNQR